MILILKVLCDHNSDYGLYEVNCLDSNRIAADITSVHATMFFKFFFLTAPSVSQQSNLDEKKYCVSMLPLLNCVRNNVF